MRAVAFLVLVAALMVGVPAQRPAVTGRAVGPNGEPLEGVTAVGATTVVTDETGVFAVDASEWIELRARGLATVRVPAAGRQDVGGVALLPGAPLAGRVVDRAGRPVGGIEVVATDELTERPFFPNDGWPLPVHRASTRTLADGTFRIDGALRTAARVTAIAALGIESSVGPVDAGEAVELVVDAVRSVAGRVVDAAGRPVERATVYVERDGVWIVGRPSDADGRFELPVPAGAGLAAAAFVLHGQVRTAAPFTVLPTEGDVANLELAMPDVELGALRVLAVDPRTGERLRDFGLGVVFRDAAGMAPSEVARAVAGRARAARNGAVEIPFVPAGTPFVVELRAPGRARARIASRTSVGDVIVALTTESIVRGRVVDAVTGAPVAAAQVAVVRSVDLEHEAARGPSVPNLPPAERLPVETTSDADGLFEVRELGAGRWTLRVASGAYGPIAETELTLGAADMVDGIEVRVDCGVTLSGRVGGAPADAWVAFLPSKAIDAKPAAMARLRADGSFVLEGLPRGRGSIDLLLPQPPRLGAPRAVELRELEVSDDQPPVELDATLVMRALQGTVRLEGSPPPRGRIAVFVEPTARPERRDRAMLVLEGTRTFVRDDGTFALFAEVGESTLLVVDAATGVVLERRDGLDVARSSSQLQVGVIETPVVRARVRLSGDAKLLDQVTRLEVEVGPLFPHGVGRMMQPTPVTHWWDCGVGVGVARGQRELELFLPASGAELRLRGHRFGQPRENVLASATVDPREAVLVEAALEVRADDGR